MKYLVAGAAGFISMHTVKRVLDMGHEVIGLDNLRRLTIKKHQSDGYLSR